MTLRLHVVVELSTWAATEATSEGLDKLERHLKDRSGITLTLVTRGPFRPALAQLSAQGRIHPHNVISDAGTAIFHRDGPEGWFEDVAYRNWAESRWSARALERFVEWGIPPGVHRVLGEYSSRHVILELEPAKDGNSALPEIHASVLNAGLEAQVIPIGNMFEIVPKGVDRGTAVVFLHHSEMEPPPLMVCGNSELNLNLFRQADYPVLMADSPLDFETPGIPRERIYRTANAGPVGVLEALLRAEFNLLAIPNRR